MHNKYTDNLKKRYACIPFFQIIEVIYFTITEDYKRYLMEFLQIITNPSNQIIR